MIAGKGRSGTTWLAQIMNSYEHCSYKHEPFLGQKSTAYNRWRDDLLTGDIDELSARFDALCLSCVHGVDQPPFPPKPLRPQNPQVLRALYAMGRRLPLLRFLYEWYGRPRFGPEDSILIKEVNFPNELLARLCQAIQPELVAIVRNPFGNLASHFTGVEKGYFGQLDPADVGRVRELLGGPGLEDLAAYADGLDGMSLPAFEALRWRIQNEPLVAFARGYERGQVIVYEDLCAAPHETAARIFEGVGWTFGDATREWIDASISGERHERSERRAYFSVFRDPRASASKWREQLGSAEQEEIAPVVRHSPLASLWKDLPL